MNRLNSRHLPVAVDRALGAVRTTDLDTRTDTDLLERFARYGEHPAFEVLLRRHGPVVYGVCRRMLANPADADDAFQATFLVLVRRARVVRGERLGPWLYGVAVRVSLKACGRAARSAARQTEATDMIPDPTPPAEPADWLPILDAELGAIPAKYREPIILCELQGLTRSAASAALGVPEGTLSSRLARGRELLRRRLLRHGTLLPAGGLTALLTASGGRSAVPVGLLTRTAELVAGAGTAGVVPAGPARLTDEVVKDMFLTKLRAVSGAVLAAGLVAVGLAAAWPAEAPGQTKGAKPGPSPTPKVAEAKPQPAKPTASSPAQPDRGALQGLWVLEKIDLPKNAQANDEDVKKQIGHMQFLVAGDVWWGMTSGPHAEVLPQLAKLDPTKNPKWLDLTNLSSPGSDVGRCIYELDGDKLRICVGGDAIRPAEFTPDEDTGVMVLQFARGPVPSPPKDKALIGSWENPFERIGAEDGRTVRTPIQRVEVLDNALFFYIQENETEGQWRGGWYTVDTTKNPKWIDVDLVGAHGEQKVTKLYGCYEVADGRLKLSLGTTGKRAVRPLELAPDRTDQPTRLFFDLGPATTPLGEGRKPVAPPARKLPPRDLPSPSVTRPSSSYTPSATTPLPPPKGPSAPVPSTVPKDATPPVPAPTPRPQPESSLPPGRDGGFGPVWDQALGLIKAGDFGKAEVRLREHLKADPDGAEAGALRFLLGVCLLGRTTDPSADPGLANARRQEALTLFRQIAAANGNAGDRDDWLWTQASLRVCQAHLLMGQPDEVVTAAAPVIERYPGTVEELIALSLVYHARRLQGRTDLAARTRVRMGEVFGQLRDEPGAFKAVSGESSRAYWERVWFCADGVRP